MFPSTLIISPSPTASHRLAGELINSLGHEKIENNPDIFLVNQDLGCGIEDIRRAVSFLSQKPYNHQSKIILISEIENLQNEAQNALLKTLEEPGANNYLILTSTNPARILPTILSRCQTIKAKTDLVKATGSLLKISGNIGDNLSLSQSLASDKFQALEILETQLKLYQLELLKNPHPSIAKIIKKLVKSIKMINSNVDYKSALDYFFLSP